VLPFQLLIAVMGGWLHREQADVIAFLREENRLLKARLAGRRLRFDDGERRRLAVLGHRLARSLLVQVATVMTPDTILRWHRELVAAHVDVSRRPRPSGGRAGTPSSARQSDGDRQSHVGLHAHSGCVTKRGPPPRPVDDRAPRACHSVGSAR
jgi:hypothetical protein